MMRLFTSPRRAAAPSQTRRTGPSALGATSPGTTSSTPSAASASRANAPPTVRPKRRRSARDAAPDMGLEEGVDEGRERRSLREHDERAEEGEHEHDRPEPPFLAHTHEGPELAQER